MHHEQDMRFYGGLRRHIPLTFWAMTAGTLAITGVGVIGVFGFAGFYSKDAIIEAAFAAGGQAGYVRSEEHTSELQSLMRISYAVFCLKKKNKYKDRLQRTLHKCNKSITIT